MITSPFFIAIIWPIAFAILQTILNGLAGEESRDGDRKYRIWYLLDGKRHAKSPLAFNQVQAELRKDKSASDVDVLPPGFLETSFGIDLCIGAMSTDLVNLLILVDVQPSILATSLQQGAIVTLTAEFIVAVGIAYFFRRWNGSNKYWARVFFVQLTNIAGLAAMFISFFILGNLLIQ